MFNDDGLGAAMSLSYAERQGKDAQEMVKRLEQRVAELEQQMRYLMRRDAEPR